MKKGLLRAACLAAIGLGAVIASHQGAMADANDTGYCSNMGTAVSVTDAGTGADHAMFFQRMSSLPLTPRCNDYPAYFVLEDVCRRWNSEAAYSSASGRRAKLYNGDVVPLTISNGQLFAWTSPSYGAGGKTFMTHNCTFFGGESRPVVTPPVVLPPKVVDGGSTTVGDGRISSTTSSSTATPSGGSIGVGGTGAGDSVGFR